MSVLFVVVPLAFVIAGIALWAFIWSVKNGQYDDLDTPAKRVATEEDDHSPRDKPE